ncbi:Flagellar hook-basal body complex protein FliE [Candidatus Syntrophocurvum alkaliphilum]|uniref:Flagellar hook-basal body complex protein FliE n=1 Tax=Candidatus Syntrophocurvum alkaliphilum TaxID=2293317 RepID=A0A6I6DEQ0_9FIRM|nr:flagellar hook-basal body complex protein FliE [Candidatus Syntrophocurvum alkaliphilum]QGT99162.1 Flagellar hook-basal body complex protein FliE [Candidatus Syntrophocurvum alkaliphilum]
MKLNLLEGSEILKNIAQNNPESKVENKDSFSKYFKNALNEVDELQKEASYSAQRLALGDESYLHNTMIAYEKANLSLLLTIEIRDKLLESYQEIMRMQM